MNDRWLFSARTDVLAFAGAAGASLAFGFGWPAVTGHREVTPALFLLFVVGVDVAHVWSTLFRTYLDGAELRRRPRLYALAPFLAYVTGVLLALVSVRTFWTGLAYLAVFHFVRQQVGWMSLYGRKAHASRATRWLDALAMYGATLGPIAWWHAHLPRPFSWFVENDFLAGLPAWAGTGLLVMGETLWLAWLLVTLWGARRPGGLHWGKLLLGVATAATWGLGIVVAQDDVAFTSANVVLHGVPYFVLLHRYAKGRAAEEGFALGRLILRGGVAAFWLFLVAVAYLEEFLWDRLVWLDHPGLFGGLELGAGADLLPLVVPLLALPQATHYVLDAFIWKPSSTPELLLRLGWTPAAPPAA